MFNFFKIEKSFLTFKTISLIGFGLVCSAFADETKDNYVEIFSKISESNKYISKIVSKQTLDNEKSSIKYILITGDIYSKDNLLDRFSVSLNENYINNLKDLKIEIEDLKTKNKYSCQANFLDKVSSEYSYHTQINIGENGIECSLKSQNKNNDISKIDTKVLKTIDKDRVLINKDKLEDLKNVENFNIISQEKNKD